MGCTVCLTKKPGSKPKGCKSNGYCQSGGCNKLNTYNWLADLPDFGSQVHDIVEISFNKGSRKDFYRKRPGIRVDTGDVVVVESQFGNDIGEITLSGELVGLQMKKKNKRSKNQLKHVIRRANDRDLEKLKEAKRKENEIMIRARAIARTLKMNMKIGAVELQADGRKVTFYYTAEERVDFRELIKEYASAFKTKIEMRQIGSRQEAGKIGGIGSCGRELCCSTWLTDFKSVSTAAARYQNLAINQAKLSGQCGRLKCCLNYELDTYMEALLVFPENADKLKTQNGTAFLQKTDIFKKEMVYCYKTRLKYYKLSVDRVKEILEMNKQGKLPEELIDYEKVEIEIGFEDTVGQLTLETLEKTSRKRRNKRRKKNKNKNRNRGQGGNQNRSSNNNK
jgi:cell fate regulator YaaT (PSP1 superfamily)